MKQFVRAVEERLWSNDRILTQFKNEEMLVWEGVLEKVDEHITNLENDIWEELKKAFARQ